MHALQNRSGLLCRPGFELVNGIAHAASDIRQLDECRSLDGQVHPKRMARKNTYSARYLPNGPCPSKCFLPFINPESAGDFLHQGSTQRICRNRACTTPSLKGRTRHNRACPKHAPQKPSLARIAQTRRRVLLIRDLHTSVRRSHPMRKLAGKRRIFNPRNELATRDGSFLPRATANTLPRRGRIMMSSNLSGQGAQEELSSTLRDGWVPRRISGTPAHGAHHLTRKPAVPLKA